MTGQALKPCPYRKEHEWDKDNLCRHCYAAMPHEHFWRGVVGDATWRCDCGLTRTFESAGADDGYFVPVPLTPLSTLLGYQRDYYKNWPGKP